MNNTTPRKKRNESATCATCPYFYQGQSVSVSGFMKYGVTECHRGSPVVSDVRAWPKTIPDSHCGEHPDFWEPVEESWEPLEGNTRRLAEINLIESALGLVHFWEADGDAPEFDLGAQEVEQKVITAAAIYEQVAAGGVSE